MSRPLLQALGPSNPLKPRCFRGTIRTLARGTAPLTFEDAASPSAPSAFGSFRVMHQLGAGVLGPVFRASAPETGQPVAIKAFHLDLTPELADELTDALQQLVDTGLAHPGIVTPLAVGCERSVPYLAQDYVAAESLDVAMRHYAPAAAERAVPLIYHLAGAVDAAHRAGVLHGSLHLRDVFVSPDEARATGFGIARALEYVSLRAPVRRPYAAPEVVAGSEWGPEADRYAVAAIAYELLTGRRATGSGDEIIERLGSVYVGDEGALPALRDVFAWGLSEEPSGRPERAVELVRALAEALGVDVIEPEPVDAPAASGDPPAVQPLVAPESVLRSGEVEDSPAEPFDADEPYDEPSEAMDAGVDADRPGPALLGEHADTGADGDGAALPASLREGGAEPLAPEVLLEEEELDPLDDLEPIEDEEPLSLGGRVRAILQGTAAVVLGVLGAGVVYFLFGAEVGVGGGEAPVPDGGVGFGEGTASRPAPGEPAVRTPNAASLPPLAEPVHEPASHVPPPGRAGRVPPLPDVPDAEAVREPAAAAPEVGWLLVRTSPPGAAVSVEGADRGQTPLSLSDVPYGTHRVEVRAPGYEPQTRDVTVSAAATVAAVSFELAPGGEPQVASAQPPAPVEPAQVAAPAVADAGEGTVGSVFVESRPAGARVVIDGEPAGVTPVVLTDLRPGRHEVRIEHAGYRSWVTAVEVPAFDRVRVAASLDQARP